MSEPDNSPEPAVGGASTEEPDSGSGRGLLSGVLARFPESCRRPLQLDAAYNVGSGAFYCLTMLTGVILETILDGRAIHLAVFWAAAHGSSILSPLVGFAARKVSMKQLVVVPNIITVVLLLGAGLYRGDATWCTMVLSAAFVMRVFPRTSEMNMYRVLYPTTHRGAAVGILKSIMGVSALLVTVAGYLWFKYDESYYWVLFVGIALMLLVSALFYGAIPIRRQDELASVSDQSSWAALVEGLQIFLTDRRFLLFQVGFALAGTANHMVFWMLPNLCHDYLEMTANRTRLIAAVIPALLVTCSAPFWGRYLDRTNPMLGRATFNVIQATGFTLVAFGGAGGMDWVVVLGIVIHGVSAGGSAVNWLTGSLHFAGSDRVSLYNAVHVGLTGVRGLLAPLVGFGLYAVGPLFPDAAGSLREVEGIGMGPRVFWIATGLSLAGAVTMLWQGLTDPGPRAEQDVPE
ncbi:MAG TPA: hypothetical protein DIC23_02285 [Planctomycetaceae bacterium]|nr:hypothetical protein [Planctomycetaceae bacterium]